MSNCVDEVIAQFLVLLVAFSAPKGRQCSDYTRQNVLERHRPKAKVKVSESIAQVSVDTFAVLKNLLTRRACRYAAHVSSVDIGMENSHRMLSELVYWC